MNPPVIIVSAVNFTEGGPLTILRECLTAAADSLPPDWKLIALVHRADLVDVPRVRFIEIPDAKQSWWRRIRWEWFGFQSLSAELKPALWLSLHDITPRVTAARQAVYCHNPAPFYRLSWREAFLEPQLVLFNRCYGLLYRSFIRKNCHVIVQQEWLRKEFQSRFGPLPVVVAHPASDRRLPTAPPPKGGVFVFLYPALPRVFKNFEVLCEAAAMLNRRGIAGFEVRITLDGTENRYARWLKARFGATPNLHFIGRQNRQQMADQYQNATTLVFPSRLETWGLPIMEAKSYGLPLLVADAPYARETVGTYDRVSFFPPASAESLADEMQAMMQETWVPQTSTSAEPVVPYARNWSSLWALLTEGLEKADAQATLPNAEPIR